MTPFSPRPDSGANDDLSDLDLELAAILDQLGEQFATALGTDSSLTAESFAASHPDAPAAALIPVLRGIEMLARSRRKAEGPFRLDQVVGPYRIKGELGRGGMGVVYEAVEEGLGRVVAIKAMNATGTDERYRLRFAREARAAARLDHPGIVPVFGSGVTGDVLWYAMRRIDGVGLDRCITDLAPDRAEEVRRAAVARLEGTVSSGSRDIRGAVSGHTARVRAAASIAMRLADALAYAHSEGVLHRDIKPANVMLDRDGSPLLTDFGLCKVEGDASLTAETDIVGTLRYMPPEALSGKADARGDVYSLGLILHELVSGAPAFEADDRRSMLHRILHVDPLPLRRTVPGVPEDLERIVAKATAKLPEERYASAADFAEDLSALLAGKPVRARASSAFYLARLFVRRNRALTATMVVAAVLLAAGTAQYVIGLREAFADVSAARDLADARAAQANVAAAEASLRTFDTSGAAAAVKAVDAQYRDWMWRHVAERVGWNVEIEETETTDLIKLASSPGGDVIAICGRDGIEIRDGDGLEVLDRLPIGAVDVEFVDDGSALVFLRRSPRALMRWDLGGGDPPQVLAPLGSSVQRIFTLPGESFGIVIDGYQRVVAYDLVTGEQRWWRKLEVPRISVAAPLTRTRFVFGTTGGHIYELDVTDDSLRELRAHPGYVRTLLVEDGVLLASGSDDGMVSLLPALTGHTYTKLKLDGGALTIARNPDNRNMLAVATAAKTVALINVTTGVVERSLTGLQSNPVGVHFGRDPWLCVFLNGSEFARYEASAHDGRIELPPALGNMYPPAASDDGHWIAAESNDNILHIYDLQGGSVRSVPHPKSGGRHEPAFDPLGRHVASGGHVVELDTGSVLFEMDPTTAKVYGSVCTPDGSVVMIGTDLGPQATDADPVRAWRWTPGANSAEELGSLNWFDGNEFNGSRWVRAVPHPDEPSLFVVSSGKRLSRFDLDPFAERWRLPFDAGRIMALDHDPVQDEIYFVADDGLVHVVDAETGEEFKDRAWRAGPRFTRRAALNSVAIGPEPGLVTTCTVDCRIEVWEAETGRRCGSLTTSLDTYMRHVAVLGGRSVLTRSGAGLTHSGSWVIGVGGFGRVVLYGSGENPAARIRPGSGMDLASTLERVQDWLVEYEGSEWMQGTATAVLRSVTRSTRFRSTPWLEERRAEIQAMLGD